MFQLLRGLPYPSNCSRSILLSVTNTRHLDLLLSDAVSNDVRCDDDFTCIGMPGWPSGLWELPYTVEGSLQPVDHFLCIEFAVHCNVIAYRSNI